MLTPKGLSVRSRILAISALTTSSSPELVSIIPSPPAFETADASWARAIHPMGAWMMGTSMPSRSVIRVEMRAMAGAYGPGPGPRFRSWDRGDTAVGQGSGYRRGAADPGNRAT